MLPLRCYSCEDGRAEKLKEQYGVEKACTDYKELIGDPKVDAVIVTTPDHTHCEIASAFLRDGKPVLLEKPMALKKEDCEELLRVSKETGYADGWSGLPLQPQFRAG